MKNERNGWTSSGTPVQQFFAPGISEKCFDTIREGPPYNGGGPLFLVRVTEPSGIAGAGKIYPAGAYSQGPANYPLPGHFQDDWRSGYMGSFVHTGLPDVVSIGGKWLTKPSDYHATLNPDDLSGLGSRAYGRLRPKVEVAGLGQAIAEAKDVPRMLKTSAKGFHEVWKSLSPRNAADASRLMSPKSATEQFLNYQFGWKPFLKDVGDMYDLVTNYTNHLTRTTGKNDKWQKRRFFEDTVSTSKVVENFTRSKNHVLFRTYLAPAIGSNTCQSVSVKITRETVTRYWYEGSFKYYRPEFDESSDMHPRVRAARQFLTLAGANVSPSLIYKVTPWSWLLDWFSSVGDSVQRIEDMITGQVVTRYMYLMRETYDRYVYQTEHVFPNTRIACTSYQEVRVKRRVDGSGLYGFQGSPRSLSATQLGILAALGLSRT